MMMRLLTTKKDPFDDGVSDEEEAQNEETGEEELQQNPSTDRIDALEDQMAVMFVRLIPWFVVFVLCFKYSQYFVPLYIQA
jgi:hypothetical protein